MELKSKHLTLSSLLVAGLLSGCSADNGAENDITSNDVIRMTVKNDWQALTRTAFIYEDDSQLTPFKVFAYKHGTDDKFIDGSRVVKNGEIWEPDHRYYWPVLDALDFFAYMPYDLTNCVVDAGNVDYVPASGPTFSCTMPSSSEGQDDKSEFIYAYVTDKKRDTDAAGVKLDFHHPFAAVRFVLNENNDNVTINSIVIKNAMTGGTFSHGATPQWSGLSGAADLTLTVNKLFEKKSEVQAITGPYLVIPQTFAGNKQTIVVNFSDNGISDVLEAEITDPSWTASNIYTYKLTIDTSLKVTVTTIDINPWTKYEWN
jgi:hypothetical protein